MEGRVAQEGERREEHGNEEGTVPGRKRSRGGEEARGTVTG